MTETNDKTENEPTIEDDNEVKTEEEADTKQDEDKAEKDEDHAENEVNEPTDEDETEENDENTPKKHRGKIWLLILLLLALLAAAAYYFKDQLKELYDKYFGQTTEAVVEETQHALHCRPFLCDSYKMDKPCSNRHSR